MRVPAAITLCDRTAKFKYVPQLLDDEQYPIFAQTVDSDNQIIVSRSRPINAEQVKQTILHELIHWVLGITGASQALKDPQEEVVAHALEHLSTLLIFDPKSRRVRWIDVEFDFEEERK